MVVAILTIWIALLWLLVAVGVFEKWTLWMKLSPVALYLVLIIGLLIPMIQSAPLGQTVVLTYSVQIAPSVSGLVREVPIKAGTALKKGDILFKLDPLPFEAKVNQVKAQLALAKLKLEQKTRLAKSGTGPRTEREEAQANVDQLTAQFLAVKWELDQTVVRSPTEGYVPNQALQPGVRVNAGVPVMPFIDSSRLVVVMKVAQDEFRHIRVGQPAELIFDIHPGRTFPGRVKFIVQANPAGQVTPSGLAFSANGLSKDPFIVELKLDEPIDNLPPGSVGEAAVYTESLSITHPVRRIMLRMDSLMNYLPL